MSRKIVGFDRKIEMEWLDYAGARAVEGLPEKRMRAELWDFLDGRVSAGSSGWNSDRGKVITVLMRIWGPGQGNYEGLRRRAIETFGDALPEGRRAVHWALCLGSYPFFESVASVIGRHLALHGEAELREVRRRAVEQWGDRAVVRLGVQRILRSLIDWSALCDGERRGQYLPVHRIAPGSAEAGLLVEGLLLSQPGLAIPAKGLSSHPSLFPFEVRVETLGLPGRGGPFRLEREGVDSEFLRLERTR